MTVVDGATATGGPAAVHGPAVGVARATVTIASLKWHLLLGGFRRSTQARVQLLSAGIASFLLGAMALLLLATLGRSAAIADDLLVVLLPALVLGVGLLSAATGVESTIDPRHLASEPIGRWHLGIGMLAAAAVGPPAMLAVLTGAGVLAGWWSAGAGGAAITVAAVLGWWCTLLLFSRTLANLLGAVATTRFRQLAHAGATFAALFALLITQILVTDPEGWDAQRWETLAGIAQWSPPGQLGLAIAGAGGYGPAMGHLVLGLAWLPVLLVASVMSTEHLALSSPRPGGGPVRRAGRRSAAPRSGHRLIPRGTVGALARRTIRTKLRTPRQVVNTITALAVGAGVYFLAPVLGGDVDSRIVIVGGVLHFAVLFDGNNAFGMDGPAMWTEVAAGADGRALVRGKVLSSLVVMCVPAVVLPFGLAVMTSGWRWLPAGWLVAVGSVLAAAGVAVLSAALAPFALPESPNPLAGGDTGQGCVAGLMLTGGVIGLAVVSAPAALAIAVASTVSAPATTLAALLAPTIGAATLWGGVSLAAARVTGREAELVEKVTPAR